MLNKMFCGYVCAQKAENQLKLSKQKKARIEAPKNVIQLTSEKTLVLRNSMNEINLSLANELNLETIKLPEKEFIPAENETEMIMCAYTFEAGDKNNDLDYNNNNNKIYKLENSC